MGMLPFRPLMTLATLLQNILSLFLKKWISVSALSFLLLSGTAIGGTPIEQDPKGFFGHQWGDLLAHQHNLKEIDASNTLHIYTIKQGNPQVNGIPMESVKLYSLDGQYARVLFRYKGKSTHASLLKYLENRFGRSRPTHGGMMRGLNQQYTWRGPDTEITVTYHGFRERGFLAAESRVLAPKFLDVHSDDSF